jgi:hypothetical protein
MYAYVKYKKNSLPYRNIYLVFLKEINDCSRDFLLLGSNS